MKSTFPKDKFGRPRQLLLTRVSSLNLQGTGQKRGILRRREVYTTTLQIDVVMGVYKWRVARTFDECVALHSVLYPSKEIEFMNVLPSGIDSEDDTFVLLQRKELLEAFLSTITTDFDVFANNHLFSFLDCDVGLVKLFHCLVVVQARARSWLVRRHVLEMLASRHSSHLLRLKELLVEGIIGIDYYPAASTSPARGILKLVPADTRVACRSRYCHVQFASALDRLIIIDRPRSSSTTTPPSINPPGIYLCDVAEIRLGPSSFMQWRNQHTSFDSSRTFSIIAAENTLDIQLPASTQYTREWLTTYLHLLASITNPNIAQYHRSWNNSLVVDVSRPIFPASKDIPIAENLRNILLEGIEVHVEWIHSSKNQSHASIEEMVLWYNSINNRIEVCPTNEAPTSTNTKGLFIDDISEVRPGIRGKLIDTKKQQLAISLIGSEVILTLPLAAASTQHQLLSQFRAFVNVYRNPQRPIALATMTIPARLASPPNPTPSVPMRRRSLKEEQENERGSMASLDALPSPRQSSTSISSAPPAALAAIHVTVEESYECDSRSSTTVDMELEGRTSEDEYFAAQDDSCSAVDVIIPAAKPKKNILSRAAHKIRKSIHKQLHM